MLGNDDGASYERDAAVLRLTVRRGDLPDIAAAAEQAAGVAIAGAREGGRIDVVTGLARPLVADFVGRYLGVPGPTPEVLLRWAHELARAAFCNDEDDPDVVDTAREAAAELGGYIDVMFASRRTQIARSSSAAASTSVSAVTSRRCWSGRRSRRCCASGPCGRAPLAPRTTVRFRSRCRSSSSCEGRSDRRDKPRADAASCTGSCEALHPWRPGRDTASPLVTYPRLHKVAGDDARCTGF